MMRAMTALCAVATAFALCSIEGRAAGAARHRAAATRAAAKPARSHEGRSEHLVGARDERSGRSRRSERAEREPAPVVATGSSRSETSVRRAGKDDAIVVFEEPSEAPRVSGRSKTVSRLEPGEREEPGPDRPREKQRKKRRLVRPCPPNASWRPYRHEPWRRGYVSVSGHGKSWSGYLVGPEGEVLPAARQALSVALASWRTGREMLIDERLVSLIADVSDEFGGRPLRIVSGYREHSFAPGSKHKLGQAFDFSIPGVPNEALRDFLRTLPDTGVGYYPNSTHVHLDVRDTPTYWVDYSAPGAQPMYSYDRRVAGMTPRERAIAAALDALSSRHEPLGKPATTLPARFAARSDAASAKPSAAPPVTLARAAFAAVEARPTPSVPDAASRAMPAAAEPDGGVRPSSAPAYRATVPGLDAGTPRGLDAGVPRAEGATR